MAMIRFGEVIHRCTERRIHNHEPYIACSAFADFPESMIFTECKTRECNDQNCKTLHAKKAAVCN